MLTHPIASVTVKLYSPAFTVKVPVPVYGSVPPLAITSTVVVPPKHVIVPAKACAVTPDSTMS